MSSKNYAEVLIDGKIYTLGGSEDEHYLQRVASYINEKTSELKRQEGFSKQSQDYQAVMAELNIADDNFKAKEEAARANRQRDEMEKDSYSLKHELVTTQMKLEAALRELEVLRKRPEGGEKSKKLQEENQKLQEENQSLQEDNRKLREENQSLRAVKAAQEHAASARGNSQKR